MSSRGTARRCHGARWHRHSLRCASRLAARVPARPPTMLLQLGYGIMGAAYYFRWFSLLVLALVVPAAHYGVQLTPPGRLGSDFVAHAAAAMALTGRSVCDDKRPARVRVGHRGVVWGRVGGGRGRGGEQVARERR